MAQNILILSLTRMGDLIQTTPLIQGLKDKHPNARITLMVSSDFEDAVSLIPDVDDSIVFNLRVKYLAISCAISLLIIFSGFNAAITAACSIIF